MYGAIIDEPDFVSIVDSITWYGNGVFQNVSLNERLP
jgi:hypothetical protein